MTCEHGFIGPCAACDGSGMGGLTDLLQRSADSWQLPCMVAEIALPIWEAWHPYDLRPRRAIEARRKWLRIEITDAELEAAAQEAWDSSEADYASAAANYAACAAFIVARCPYDDVGVAVTASLQGSRLCGEAPCGGHACS